MKKIQGLALLLAAGFVLPAPAAIPNYWADEDEEYNYTGKVLQVGNWWDNEDEEYNMKGNSPQVQTPARSASSKPLKTYANPAPKYQTNPMDLTPDFILADISSDNTPDKWINSVKSVFWEDYRGNNVRIELLRNNADVKEMRLKFVQSQDMNADPDGSVVDMLDTVAARVMKRTCGKKAKSAVTLYERPSVEYSRATAADPLKPVLNNNVLREYGFRCVY